MLSPRRERNVAYQSASAYLALGMTEIAWRWDIRGAGALLNRGLALDPHDPEAHILRGNWFKWQGKADSAVAEYRKSYAVDPLSTALRAPGAPRK